MKKRIHFYIFSLVFMLMLPVCAFAENSYVQNPDGTYQIQTSVSNDPELSGHEEQDIRTQQNQLDGVENSGHDIHSNVYATTDEKIINLIQSAYSEQVRLHSVGEAFSAANDAGVDYGRSGAILNDLSLQSNSSAEYKKPYAANDPILRDALSQSKIDPVSFFAERDKPVPFFARRDYDVRDVARTNDFISSLYDPLKRSETKSFADFFDSAYKSLKNKLLEIRSGEGFKMDDAAMEGGLFTMTGNSLLAGMREQWAMNQTSVQGDYQVMDSVMVDAELAATHLFLNPSNKLHPVQKLLFYFRHVTEKKFESYKERMRHIQKINDEAAKNDNLKIRYRGKILDFFNPLLDDMGGPLELVRLLATSTTKG